MPKHHKQKKISSKNPNPWINLLSKKGIKIYPEMFGFHFKIAVNNNGRVTTGNKTYTTATINEGLLIALEFMYKKLKDL